MWRALEGSVPEKSIVANVRMFPAGILPMYGWLSHTQILLHSVQVCVICKNVPITTFFIVAGLV